MKRLIIFLSILGVIALYFIVDAQHYTYFVKGKRQEKGTVKPAGTDIAGFIVNKASGFLPAKKNPGSNIDKNTENNDLKPKSDSDSKSPLNGSPDKVSGGIGSSIVDAGKKIGDFISQTGSNLKNTTLDRITSSICPAPE